jgi:predicted acylesterase/phospholipase RssA
MKGGITSGIVYPKAIYEISKKYRFVNIGGTSAGAIAACLTAAAEYRRRETGNNAGYEMLDKLPEELCKEINGITKLFTLFKPNPSTEKIFNSLFVLAKVKGKTARALLVLWHLIKGFPLTALVCILLGAAVWHGSSFNPDPSGKIISWIILGLFTLVIVILATSVRFAFYFNKKVTKNCYGLTTGYVKSEKKDSLTEWLADKIDNMAGRPYSLPLTFGDLEWPENNDDKIKLRMVTTCLTLGKPVALPFEEGFKNFFLFSPDEFKNYFPERIVTWMAEHSEPFNSKLRWMPQPEDIPVIVAVRMSLSFPGLFSAVPLYGIDYTEPEADKKAPYGGRTPRRCLFSDGGICSNFPIHFFDSPLPRRPTFGLNLRKLKKEYGEVYMPPTNRSGLTYQWNPAEGSVITFTGWILNTFQEWMDNEYLRLPGYRDRIAHIHVDDNEGGLNLNMKPEQILQMSKRGEEAGAMLRGRFSGEINTKMNWNNQRWIRFRTTMCLLQEYLFEIERAFAEPAKDNEQTYDELLYEADTDSIPSYPMNLGQKNYALNVVDGLKDFIRNTLKSDESFCENKDAPRPRPELRTKPRL